MSVFEFFTTLPSELSWLAITWQWITLIHQRYMPWLGWALAVLIMILGPIWLLRTLRRAGRALYGWMRNLRRRRQMIQAAIRRHLVTQQMFENCATPGLIEDPPRSRLTKR